ncbi:dihydroneopterin aldolase / 2-amino-4-hydroxy-6-hydroxymethyldihydropteridine diphosphokinase [Lachnospiraceae bacterium XBB1006]|nr:dihydroneopterin aldolase / 2-amino-4-hydroxy-6-hydroxymethyldihydropteridine diphosphokinase [Lachnospiraceae bacterium XBB1006]
MKNSQDFITIDHLLVFGNHGVYSEENALGQKFYVTAKLFLDTRAAGLDDELEQSVNYGTICKEIHGFFQEHTYRLIEAVAEHLAAHLLMFDEKIRGVELTISKPWAPIGLPVDTVSVTIQRKWHTAYIALGSNVGNKAAYLIEAIEQLGQIKGCRVERVSDFIVTEPYGGVPQDDFLNAVLKMETLMKPEELLIVLHSIEATANRVREIHWGPRTLDLDILFYDDEIYQSKDLVIPHVDMEHREFVLQPMCQIAPYYMHPVFRKSMKQMYDELMMEQRR